MSVKAKFKESGIESAEALASGIKGTAQIAGAAAETAGNTSEMIATFSEEAKHAGPHIGKIATHAFKAANHTSGIITAPLKTIELATKALLTPVDRLLTSFTHAVNRGFDMLDAAIMPQAAPVPLAVRIA